MPRLKKEHTVITIKMDKELADALNQFCEETYRTKTAAIELAVGKMIEEYEKTKKKGD